MEPSEYIHTEKDHIEVDPDAELVHARPYAVPKIHLLTFKKELDHLVELGEPVNGRPLHL